MLSEIFHKNMLAERPDTLKESQSGQGLIEFLLVLFLSLSVIGGIVYQFGTAFGSFSEDYFGSYLSCLLETGELPTLGNENGSAAGECDAEFQPFSLTNGRPPQSSTPGAARSSQPRVSVRGQSSRQGRGAFRRSRPTGNGDQGNRGAPANQSLSGSESSGRRSAVGSGSYEVGRGATARAATPQQRSRIAPGRIAQRGARGRSSTIAQVQNRGGGSRSSLRRKKQVQKIKKPVPVDLNFKAGWTASKIFRYLIMFGLFLFLLIIIGFQAMQIKKSMDAE